MPKPTTLCAAAAAVVTVVVVLMGAVPEEAAVAVLAGALVLGVAVVLVCLLLISTVGRRRVPPRHGTVETDGAAEQAVIFDLPRVRLVLAGIVMAATVPVSLSLGGVPLITGAAAVRTGESTWTDFLLTSLPAAVLWLGMGIYMLERSLWFLGSLRSPVQIACTATALHIQMPVMREALPWNEVLSVVCDGTVLGIAVGDGSPVWARYSRTVRRNMRKHGFPIWLHIKGISHAPLLDEIGKHLDG